MANPPRGIKTYGPGFNTPISDRKQQNSLYNLFVEMSDLDKNKFKNIEGQNMADTVI
jgi:hypothetical protein